MKAGPFSLRTHLAYAENVERGRVERPHEEVLRPQRLHDHRLPRAREVGHRVITPHRVAETPTRGVHSVEVPARDFELRYFSDAHFIIFLFEVCARIHTSREIEFNIKIISKYSLCTVPRAFMECKFKIHIVS